MQEEKAKPWGQEGHPGIAYNGKIYSIFSSNGNDFQYVQNYFL